MVTALRIFLSLSGALRIFCAGCVVTYLYRSVNALRTFRKSGDNTFSQKPQEINPGFCRCVSGSRSANLQTGLRYSASLEIGLTLTRINRQKPEIVTSFFTQRLGYFCDIFSGRA